MSIPSIDERLKNLQDQYENEHSCKCPNCGFDLDSECEYMVDLVTYHGEEGRLEQTCPSCDTDFWVEEHVDRTWSVFKTEDETEEF